VGSSEYKVGADEETCSSTELKAAAEANVADAVVGELLRLFLLEELHLVTEVYFVIKVVFHFIIMLVKSTLLNLTSNVEKQESQQNMINLKI